MPPDWARSRPVLAALGARIRAVVRRALAVAGTGLREAFWPAPVVAGLVHDLARFRKELVAENALLRHQLIVASRKVKRPRFRPLDRGLLVALTRLLPRWRDALLLVKPETVLRWHREGFRLFWKRRSQATKPREPRLSSDTTELISKDGHRESALGRGAHPRGTPEAGHPGRQAHHPAPPPQRASAWRRPKVADLPAQPHRLGV
jgi:hypothetical protein